MIKISEYITKETTRMINQVKRSSREVLKGQDPEAIHNFRVNIRRLRSFLQTIVPLYHKPYIKHIISSLKQIANETNDLRDLEVFLEKVQKFNMPDHLQEEFQNWLHSQHELEQKERDKIQKKLQQPNYLYPVRQLEGLMLQPIPSKSDIWAEDYAMGFIAKARQDWLDDRTKIDRHLNDSEWLHDFRIESKKVRYNIAFYQNVLPPSYGEVAKAARKMQNTLGEINDYHVMEQKIQKDNSLSAELKAELKQNIQEQLDKQKKKLQRKKENL
jgi:phosphohistidine phosphatase